MSATGFAPATAEGLHLRDGHRCSMEGFKGCPGTSERTTDPGHRLNRGSGGDPRDFINDPANGAAQHHACNWKLEHTDDFAEEGRRRGCKLSHTNDDLKNITTTPMWSPFYGQWVLLQLDGMHLTGIRDSKLDARLADQWLPGAMLTNSEGPAPEEADPAAEHHTILDPIGPAAVHEHSRNPRHPDGDQHMSFEAHYHGTCVDCGGHISPGDQVEREGNGYRHETCPDDPSVSLRPGEKACDRCFLVHPEGTCDA